MKTTNKAKRNIWVFWALGEASISAVSVFILKLAGLEIGVIDQAIVMTLALSLFQVIFSAFTVFFGRKYQVKSREIGWMVAFGFIGFFMDVMALTVFQLGGSIIIFSLIFSLSIIPGAVIDRVWFGIRFSWRQIIGIMVGALAIYSMFGWPSFGGNFSGQIPVWVWLSVLVSIAAALNQGISVKVRNSNPLVMNMVGGAAMVILAMAALMIRGNLDLIYKSEQPFPLLWQLSFVLGLLVVGQWTCNLSTYRYGQEITITLKKLVVRSGFLLLSAGLGALFFSEAFSIPQIVGIVLFLVSFALIKEEAWQFLANKVKI
ncbi:MAG: hypothetical protein WCW77_03780 [Patescibacteria group bacterium]|jgi:drug/metabolite transporter (DMT)-like permease